MLLSTRYFQKKGGEKKNNFVPHVTAHVPNSCFGGLQCGTLIVYFEVICW